MEWEPLSSQSLRCSYGVTSSTTRTPASSQAGRPAGNRPAMTHSLNGSVGTGEASTYPCDEVTASRSASVVTGVIRSTMEVAKSTLSSIQPSRSGSTSSTRSLDDLGGNGAVLRQVVARQDRDRPGSAAPAGEQTGDQLGGQRDHRRGHVLGQGLDVGSYGIGVEVPVRRSQVAGLGDRDGDHRHLGTSKVVEVGLVLARRVHRRNRPDHLELVAVDLPGDQGVEAVLGRQRLRRVGAPAGEGGDAPLRCVTRPGGVPGLVGAVEVAQTEMDDPDRRCRGSVGEGAAQPRVGHSLNAFRGLVTTRSCMVSTASSSSRRPSATNWARNPASRRLVGPAELWAVATTGKCWRLVRAYGDDQFTIQPSPRSPS